MDLGGAACRTALWAGLSCSLLAAGCSAPVVVGGRVTLDGRPIDGGQISFLPETAGRRPAWTKITGGRYEIGRAARLAPGRHRVEIRWLRPTGRKQPALPPATGESEVLEEAMPRHCNDESTLAATLVAGRNSADFTVAAAEQPAGR